MFKKVVAVACLIIVSQFLFSQESDSIVSEKALYGFSLGIHRSSLSLDTEERQFLKKKDKIGFRLGIVADYKIYKRLHFVPKLELAFYGNELTYFNGVQEESEFKLSDVAMETKPHFTIELGKAASKIYILLGASYSLAIGDEEDDDMSYPSDFFFSVDVGIGYNKETPFFLFAPELRYSYNLTNINKNPDLKSDVKLHSLTLLFSFKG
ncbi:MAG: PorT family protein [Flavobacteriales bacterium]|nr:PorT family protein [Flavobacteriales bacterium]